MPRKGAFRKTPVKGKKKVLTVKDVKQIVKKLAEPKKNIVNLFVSTPVPGGGLASFGSGQGIINQDIFSTLAIVQGTEQENRIGNKIGSCRLLFSGFINSLPVQTLVNPYIPYEAHMIVYRNKKDPELNSPKALVQLPANNLDFITGTVMNSTYPWNKDGYVILKHKVWHMNPRGPDNPPSVAIPGVNFESRSVSYKRFKVAIDIKNTLLYNDNETAPTNEHIAVGFYFINGNGTDSTPTEIKFEVSMDAELHFTDL